MGATESNICTIVPYTSQLSCIGDSLNISNYAIGVSRQYVLNCNVPTNVSSEIQYSFACGDQNKFEKQALMKCNPLTRKIIFSCGSRFYDISVPSSDNSSSNLQNFCSFTLDFYENRYSLYMLKDPFKQIFESADFHINPSNFTTNLAGEGIEWSLSNRDYFFSPTTTTTTATITSDANSIHKDSANKGNLDFGNSNSELKTENSTDKFTDFESKFNDVSNNTTKGIDCKLVNNLDTCRANNVKLEYPGGLSDKVHLRFGLYIPKSTLLPIDINFKYQNMIASITINSEGSAVLEGIATKNRVKFDLGLTSGSWFGGDLFILNKKDTRIAEKSATSCVAFTKSCFDNSPGCLSRSNASANNLILGYDGNESITQLQDSEYYLFVTSNNCILAYVPINTNKIDSVSIVQRESPVPVMGYWSIIQGLSTSISWGFERNMNSDKDKNEQEPDKNQHPVINPSIKENEEMSDNSSEIHIKEPKPDPVERPHPTTNNTENGDFGNRLETIPEHDTELIPTQKPYPGLNHTENENEPSTLPENGPNPTPIPRPHPVVNNTESGNEYEISTLPENGPNPTPIPRPHPVVNNTYEINTLPENGPNPTPIPRPHPVVNNTESGNEYEISTLPENGPNPTPIPRPHPVVNTENGDSENVISTLPEDSIESTPIQKPHATSNNNVNEDKGNHSERGESEFSDNQIQLSHSSEIQSNEETSTQAQNDRDSPQANKSHDQNTESDILDQILKDTSTEIRNKM
ncbi:serine/threonine rich low complexity protein [Cryptosporidium felis]|nr:serine/threonine rich low complexity protein [Cryptosporidium felis]